MISPLFSVTYIRKRRFELPGPKEGHGIIPHRLSRHVVGRNASLLQCSPPVFDATALSCVRIWKISNVSRGV
jgi:hypothetical protein